jgi:hypothetical protein
MQDKTFMDYFSDNSGNYRKFRPVYPDALYAYLASIAPSPSLAWDCATGSGQAALKLAHHERQGTDPMDIIRRQLAKEWGAPDRRYKVDWPLTVIVGRNI